jgi:HD-GYP domain-containing protein (c-di-GMP phosphodiesterase class II)
VTHPFIHRIRLYAPFHDIGKYMIPDEILYSNRRYTPQEREIMNRHTVYGEGIIDDVISLSSVNSVSSEEIAFIKNIVRHHHEHFNGKGLPDGLKGESIPLEARIVTLADVFDALLSKRAYKPAWSVEQVVEYIEENEGVIFDPQCVRVLVSNLELFLDIRATYVDRAEAVDAIAS